MTQARVQLVGKRDCHLCDDARATIAAVCEETGNGWTEVFIDDDPMLADEYADQVPVVLVDGRMHDFFRVDQMRLRAALAP